MAIRKNKKRIDPRYFLNETTHRDEIDEGNFNSEWTNTAHLELAPKELLAQVRQDKGEEWFAQLGGERMEDLIAALGPKMRKTEWYDPDDLEKYGLADHPLAKGHVRDWSPGGAYYRD